MIGQGIDVSRMKAPPSVLTEKHLIPVRHICGRIVYADLESEYPVYYTRHAVTNYGHILLTGRIPVCDCPYCEYPLNMDWMLPLFHIRPMPLGMALQNRARRVCSNCWGDLEIANYHIPTLLDDGTTEFYALLWCPVCRYDTMGYVTRRFADESRRKDCAEYDLYIASTNLDKKVDQPKQRISAEESLRLLGF